MYILLSDNFETNIGTIRTRIESKTENLISISEDNSISTSSHKIVLQSFKLPNEFYYNSLSPPKRVESFFSSD